MYNVFTDFHHAGLLQSLILLFEKRLGGNVYRPIGREWYDKGFWHIYEHPATVAQFLDVGGATPDGTQPVNEVIEMVADTQPKSPTIYHCYDIDSGFTNKAITYEGFMNMHFDIVIATIPQHIEPFKRLCELHPDKPKLIFQIGNAWTIEAGLAPNIMASAIIHDVPENINFISYHQEFNTDIFHFEPPRNTNNIFSFVNMFNLAGHFQQDWQLFETVEKLMPDWNFKSYGGQCRDGAMHGSEQLAEAIFNSRFIWHTKNAGDGYGHIIHNVPAVGRPLIVKKQYYQDKMAEALLVDEDTCICIDNLTAEQIINKISKYNEKEVYKKMAQRAYSKFKEVVNFDTEEIKIKNFLNNLH